MVDITNTGEPQNFLLTHDEVANAKAFKKSIDTKNYQYIKNNESDKISLDCYNLKFDNNLRMTLFELDIN
jgi:hypothetical protein